MRMKKSFAWGNRINTLDRREFATTDEDASTEVKVEVEVAPNLHTSAEGVVS